MAQELILTEHERQSTIWKKVAVWAHSERERLRTAIETQHSEQETNITRGEIKTFRRLLAAGKAPPSQENTARGASDF